MRLEPGREPHPLMDLLDATLLAIGAWLGASHWLGIALFCLGLVKIGESAGVRRARRAAGLPVAPGIIPWLAARARRSPTPSP